tara:strand:- start:266 stop:481 length:216 start_codon:yes stop_codon:yes gene_type:complete
MGIITGRTREARRWQAVDNGLAVLGYLKLNPPLFPTMGTNGKVVFILFHIASFQSETSTAVVAVGIANNFR